MCVLLVCHRILFANSVYCFEGWVEKHITINSMISFNDDTDNFGKISSCDSHVTLIRGIGFYEGRMRTSLDTQFLGLTEQEYIGQLSYMRNSPEKVINRNALFRALLFNNGVYYYFFQGVKQLENELVKLRRLRHPRIVRVHGIEQKGDVIYLFLDFMAGVRLFNP